MMQDEETSRGDGQPGSDGRPTAASNEPPRCKKHGLVMVQKYRYQRVNRVAELAIPTGEYWCRRCEDERR